MKINISGLMNMIAEDEKKFNYLSNSLRTKVYSVSIQELNGTINVIEDYKSEFENDLEEYKIYLDRINKFKSVLYEKNNSFKLSDGRTIQTAINDNSNLRKMKLTYDNMLSFRNIKRRVTEVNNSYFECKTVNFDIDRIKEELKDIDSRIQKTDFEISKLNSIEFEIDIQIIGLTKLFCKLNDGNCYQPIAFSYT